jgi:hypothetical protein
MRRTGDKGVRSLHATKSAHNYLGCNFFGVEISCWLRNSVVARFAVKSGTSDDSSIGKSTTSETFHVSCRTLLAASAPSLHLPRKPWVNHPG